MSDEGYISCRFTRPLKINNDQWSTDLNNDWYQLYAWGPVTTSECYFICHIIWMSQGFTFLYCTKHEAKKSLILFNFNVSFSISGYTLMRHKLAKPPTSASKKTLYFKENIQTSATISMSHSACSVLLSVCLVLSLTSQSNLSAAFLFLL